MLFRNENPVLGPSTQVTETGGSASSLVTLATASYKPTTRHVLSYQLGAPASASGAFLFVAPWACQIIAVRYDYTTAGGASFALDLRKITADAVAPTAAIGANVIDCLSANLDLTATAATVRSGGLAALANVTLAASDRLSYLMSGTIGSFAGMYLQVEIAQLG